uniref:Chromobox protein homolog 5 n=1 Tax=Lepeophtheirus salmonis TaxID=72036 RepID=C1BTK4_LEPSM|nr:Chromobox protein homolog 5 [Lepeophtheirus salmonis]
MVRGTQNGSKAINYCESDGSASEVDEEPSENESLTDTSRNNGSKRQSRNNDDDDGESKDIEDNLPLSSKKGKKKRSRSKLSVESPESDASSSAESSGGAQKKRKKEKKVNPRNKISARSTSSKYEEEDENVENDEESSSNNGSDDEFVAGKYTKKTKIPNLPAVSVMVIESIKALNEDPKKGSTFGAIKDTILRNWPVNMKTYNSRIKKCMASAEKSGSIIRTRGHGFNGRFTVPALRGKKKYKYPKLSKKFDVDEVEYVPIKTTRDKERVKDKEELERKREERAVYLEKVMADKATLPKRIKTKREFWEVKSIQGTKVKNDINYYLVKYEGSSKPQWEPEENVQNCWDLVEMFMKEKELKEAEITKIRQESEEKGEYEVHKIVDVEINKKDGSKEFRIRWKGYKPEEDTWEEEKNLNCPEKIEAFMRKHEKSQDISQKSLRETPKIIERLAYSQSKRIKKKAGGLRVTYDGME